MGFDQNTGAMAVGGGVRIGQRIRYMRHEGTPKHDNSQRVIQHVPRGSHVKRRTVHLELSMRLYG